MQRLSTELERLFASPAPITFSPGTTEVDGVVVAAVDPERAAQQLANAAAAREAEQRGRSLSIVQGTDFDDLERRSMHESATRALRSSSPKQSALRSLDTAGNSAEAGGGATASADSAAHLQLQGKIIASLEEESALRQAAAFEREQSLRQELARVKAEAAQMAARAAALPQVPQGALLELEQAMQEDAAARKIQQAWATARNSLHRAETEQFSAEHAALLEQLLAEKQERAAALETAGRRLREAEAILGPGGSL